MINSLPNMLNMMHSLFRRFVPVGILAFLISAFISCEDKFDDLGKDLFPASDFYTFLHDSSTVIKGKTLVADARNAYGVGVATLGGYQDAQFGKTEGDLITQVEITSLGGLADLWVIDSLVFQLRYDSLYGSKNYPVSFVLHELTVTLPYDSAFKTNFDPSPYYTSGSAIAEFTHIPGGDTLLRTKITNTAFLDKFRNSNNEDSVFLNLEKFQEAFKGLYIRSSLVSGTDTGALFYANLNHVQSGLSLYYRKQNDTVNYRRDIRIGNASARANLFRNDRTGAAEVSRSSENDSVLYLGAPGGYSCLIELDGLSSWIDSMKTTPIAINKAQLIIKPEADIFTGYPSSLFPMELELLVYKGPGDYTMTKDSEFDFNEGSRVRTYSGGYYNSAKREYVFNLARHLQDYLNEKHSYNTFILMQVNHRSGRRVILKSGAHSDSMKFIISYTKL